MKYLNAIILTGIAALGFSAAAATVDWSKLPPAATGTGVTFDKDIQPIFKTSCVRCHGAERPRAQLRLDTLDGVLKGTKQGSILTAGDSASSLLVKAVSQLDPETAMPPKPRARRGPGGPQGTNAPGQRPRNFGPPAKPLTPEQVGLVRAWIDQGAK
jgi:mono/diheme cytochrome c family protein